MEVIPRGFYSHFIYLVLQLVIEHCHHTLQLIVFQQDALDLVWREDDHVGILCDILDLQCA